MCSLSYCNEPTVITYASEAGDFDYCQRHAPPFRAVEKAQLPPLKPLTRDHEYCTRDCLDDPRCGSHHIR